MRKVLAIPDKELILKIYTNLEFSKRQNNTMAKDLESKNKYMWKTIFLQDIQHPLSLEKNKYKQ